jgi:transposase
LEEEADRLLSPGRADSLTETEDKIRRRLKKQRDHLFVFLDHEKVEATNNRAERRLRPAVMRRKLSCGNRTPRGAEAFERIASVVETCVQQGRSVVDYLRATMSLGMEPLPLR